MATFSRVVFGAARENGRAATLLKFLARAARKLVSEEECGGLRRDNDQETPSIEFAAAVIEPEQALSN